MRRFSFEEIPNEGNIFEAPSQYLHHLFRVLRLKKGEKIEGTDGKGFVALLETEQVGEDRILFRVLSKNMGAEVPLNCTAYVAELKHDAMEEAVSLLAEHGIQQIIPFFSERSISKYDPKDVLKKQERRQKVADEATKKVGGLYPSKVLESMPLKMRKGLELYPNKIIFYEGKTGALDLSFADFSQESAFVIGPEGGFTLKELEYFQNLGYITSSLGTRILRAPSACAAAAVCIRFYKENQAL